MIVLLFQNIRLKKIKIENEQSLISLSGLILISLEKYFRFESCK